MNDQGIADYYTLLVPLPTEDVTMPGALASKLTRGSSPWWIDRLTTELDRRSERLTKLRQYYRGEQDTWKLQSEGARLAFGRTFSGMKSNLAAPIVDAVVQRLKVEAIRIPTLDSTDPEATTQNDTEAWRIWQANGLDGRSMIAHTEAIAMGECPVIIHRDPDDPKTPRITVEDPLQVVVERNPADPRKLLAALKRWTEPDQAVVVVLYLPDRIEWWRADPKNARIVGYRSTSDTSFVLRSRSWTLDEGHSGVSPVAGVVPVVILLNRPRVDGCGQGEHESVLPLLDAVNKTILDMLTSSEFTAYPQRTAVGVSFDDEPEASTDGDEVATAKLKAAPYRVWASENPDAKLGQLEASSLSPYTEELRSLLGQIAAVSSTPYHRLLNSETSIPSTGEAMKVANEGLDEKAERDQVDLGEGWEEVFRIAFLTAGDSARASTRSEIRWRSVRTANEAQHADALVKLASLDIIDDETLLEMVPFSPEQIARIVARKAAEEEQEAAQAVADTPAPSQLQVTRSGDTVTMGEVAA